MVVTVVQGNVWLSVSPPFTWEAIMEPGKVDELMHVLELARDEAKNMVTAHNGRAARESRTMAGKITRGTSAR